MTHDAAVAFDISEPLASVLEIFAHPVAIGSGAREFTLLRNGKHGKPIERRIILRRCRCIGRQHRFQVQDLARFGSNLRRIDQPVAAYPYAIGCRGEVGDQIAPLIVRNHDFDKLGG